jgi:hypothetical protein
VLELAADLREVLPLYCAADEAIVRLLALTPARIERATAVSADIDEIPGSNEKDETVKLARLRDDVRGG